jgi:hypothetical protein
MLDKQGWSGSRRLLLLSMGLICLVACERSGDRGRDPLLERFATASDFQREFMKDGSVSFGDYETAATALVACLRREGIDAEDPKLESDRTFSFVFNDGSRAEQIFQACRTEHYDAIELAWADLVSPTKEEDRAYYEELAECISAEGFTTTPEPNSLENAYRQNPDLYQRCASALSGRTPPPPGTDAHTPEITF